MKVIAYLAFTLLSILIQFCVMDLTQEKTELDDGQVAFNGTSHKKKFHELMKDFTQKPHALYYQTLMNNNHKDLDFRPSTKTFTNNSLQRLEISTIISSTIFDELYDDNMSTTEDPFTTESLYTSTEIDNVTEISFFDKNNKTVIKPKVPKKPRNKDCGCDLLVCILFLLQFTHKIIISCEK